jgi:hypothetical protein
MAHLTGVNALVAGLLYGGGLGLLRCGYSLRDALSLRVRG